MSTVRTNALKSLMHTPKMVALKEDALANEAVYIQARNGYNVSKSKTIEAENALSNANADERDALHAMNHADDVWTTTLRDINALEEEALDARASKFRALVNASGLTTRVPSNGFLSTWTESDDDDAKSYNPTSPDYSPRKDDNPNICSEVASPASVQPENTPTSPKYDSD